MTDEELRYRMERVTERMAGADDTNDVVVSVALMRELFGRLEQMQAKLDAVPIGPIRRWYENSNPQLMEYEFIADVETDAEFIEAWLVTGVTP